MSGVSTLWSQNVEIKSENVDIIEIDEQIFTNDGYVGDDLQELQNVSYIRNIDEQIIVEEEIICKEEPAFYDVANAEFVPESQMVLAANGIDQERRKNSEVDTSSDEHPSKCEPTKSQKMVSVVNATPHEQINSGIRRTRECYICKHQSPTLYSLRSHFMEHIGTQAYKCPHCSAIFRRQWHYSRHINEMHGKYDETFTCTYCFRTFKTRQRLENHERIHTGQKPWCCSVCGKRFNTKSSIAWHMKIHTGEKPFKCTECSLEFRLEHHLDSHLKKHANEKLKTNGPNCLEIDASYADKLSIDTRTYQCYLCGFKCGNRNQLKIHMVQHTGNKLFSCKLCKKVFLRCHSIEFHMRTHKKSCDFKCDICGDEFRRKEGLKIHIQAKHSQQTVFQCQICMDKFYKKFSFVIHMRRHTGFKPFKCEFCQKTFTKKSDMVRHTRTHTGERPHQCNACKMTFTRNNLLTVHKKNIHGL